MKECEICHRTSDEVQVQYCTKYGMYLCSKHKNQLLRYGRITDGDKDERSCEICGTKSGKIHWSSAAQKMLCNKHRSQFNRLGKFLERTKRDKNIINVYDDYAEILFEDTNGEITGKAIIDVEDVQRCSEHKWMITEYMGNTRYVKSIIDGVNTGLHRFVMNATKGDVVDHINRDGLDNRKQNLRIVTTSENSVNSKTRSATGEKNIYMHHGKYQVEIVRNYKTVFMKSFKTLKEAIESRDNFIEEYNKVNKRAV